MSTEQLCNAHLRQHMKSILLKSIGGRFNDITFNIGLHQNKSHRLNGFKSLFAIQSDKLHMKILYNNNDQQDMKKDMKNNEIQITDLNVKTFSFLQKLFYGLFDIRINRELVISLMKASKLYNINHLWNACYQYLLTIDFKTYSSSFFYLLYETQIHTMEIECVHIIDLLKPIQNISEFEQFFNQQNQIIFSKICIDIVIYLLFLSNKFDSIPQEFKWKICVEWSTNNKDYKSENENDKPMQYEEQSHINKRMKSMCAVTTVSDSLFDFRLDFGYFANGKIEENNESKNDYISDNEGYNDDYKEEDFRSILYFIFTKMDWNLKQFVPYFIFTKMDWTFFVKHVYSLHILPNDKVIYILCDYVIKHSQFMLSRDRKKRFFLPTTKFINYIKLQQQFVLNIQKNRDEIDEKNVISELIQFIQFNTNNIENKTQDTIHYNKLDAAFEKHRNDIPFLYADDSKRKYDKVTSNKTTKCCISRDVYSLYSELCDSIENKLAKIINCPLLNDVTIKLNSDNSTHYGMRALFALHSKERGALIYGYIRLLVEDPYTIIIPNEIKPIILLFYHEKYSMLFGRKLVESTQKTEVNLNNINEKTFKMLQRILLGLKSGCITRTNVVEIYCFSDTYLMIDIRMFALKFICNINIDSHQKAAEFIDIILKLHKYQSDAFWILFILQIKEDNIACSKSECDYLTKHAKFQNLSKDIIRQLLFKSTLFQIYSQEMIWGVIVKWASHQTESDIFLQNTLKPFLVFFNFDKIHFFQLSSKQFLVLINNVRSYKRIFGIIKSQRWPLKQTKNILQNTLFKSLSYEITDHIIMNLKVYHNICEELLWSACVRWSKLNGKLKSFLKHFKFSIMSIIYFENNVIPCNVLTEYEIYSIYERFCDQHGIDATINTENVVKLCFGASKHSLRRLQTNCLKVVTSINISRKSCMFLQIMKQLYESNKINNFTARISKLIKQKYWSKSECLKIANSLYFNDLPLILTKLIMFESNQFTDFNEQELWKICVKWCDANSHNKTKRNKKLRAFVCYFTFNKMEITFFRAHVENLNVLTDSETMRINQNYVTHLLHVVRQKNETIREQKQVISSQQYTISCQNNTIQNQRNKINNLNSTIRSKNNYIDSLEYDIKNLKAKISRLSR